MKLLDAYKPAGLGACNHVYPRAASAERLAAISIVIWLWNLVDDPDVTTSHGAVAAEEWGIDTAIRDTRTEMERFWARLGELFKSTELPSASESVPVEKAVWEAGRLIRSVIPSTSWFDGFVETFKDHVSASCDLYFNVGSEFRSHDELEAYIDLRAHNSGAPSICCAVPVVTKKYLSCEARNHPQIRRLARLCSRYCALQNDLCSYHVEVFSANTAAWNIIEVLMETQSMSFQQAVLRVMDIMTADTQKFLEIERDPQVAELTSADDGLRDYWA